MNVYSVKIQAKAALAGHMTGLLGIGGMRLFLSVLFGFFAWILRRVPFDGYGIMIQTAGECALLVISVYLLSALQQGSLVWHIRCSTGKRPSCLPVLYWLRRMRSVKCRCLFAAVRVRKIAWFVVLQIPCAALSWVWFRTQGSAQLSGMTSAVTLSGAAVCGAVGGLFAFLLHQQYAAAAYLLAIDPTLSVRQAIRESKRCMQMSCGKMLRFKLSFIPWFLSCTLVIPLIYVVPYYRQCRVCMLQKILSGSSCGYVSSGSKPVRKGSLPQ